MDPEKISRELCTCPGMIAQRELVRSSTGSGTDSPGKLSTLIEGIQVARQARNQQRSRREAERAVASAAAGKSREEVRGMLLTELARRGLTPPPQPRLDNLADTYRTEDPVERERLIQEGRKMFHEAAAPLAREIRSLTKPPHD
jgi:phage protein D